MNIRYKICVPLVVITISIGAGCYWLIRSQLEKLNETNIQNLVEAKYSQVMQSIDISSLQALHFAALLSRLPEVGVAYKTAMEGDIHDEKSPSSQKGRELLRSSFAPMIAGFQSVAGEKPQIHYHFPPARSFVRLWRDKQTRRDDKWVDISDDLTSFRPTVVEVNRTGSPLRGVEVGSGGLEVRGLAPVMDSNVRQIGSVEVLVSFNPVLEGISKGPGQAAFLYMNSEHLKVATSLQDKSKNPIVEDAYVLVRGIGDKSIESQISKQLLDSGRKGRSWEIKGTMLLAAMPVEDYRKQQIGIIIYAQDISSQIGIMNEAGLVLISSFAVLLVVPVLVTLFVLGVAVVRPVRNMMGKIKDIAEDKANLSNRLDDSARDEIGALATWFNRLMGKIEDLLCDVEGYKNLVDAVPDPIFAVDNQYHIITANKATADYLGKTVSQLKGQTCYENMQTSVCQTPECPIEQTKTNGQLVQSKIIDIGKSGNPHFIQPVSDVLKDCHGNIIGYLEVARNVTSLVIKERESENNISYLRTINETIGDAADHLADTANKMVERFEVVSDGAAEQSKRAHETATSMEQMNSTVLDVARSASGAAEQTNTARIKAQAGAGVVAQVVSAIAEVSARASALRENMGRLGQQTESIGRIMGVISDIADQTNLLALNAAIEAARAGDAGRGFAVVADEVRKLAEKTMLATQEVAEAITSIQAGARSNMREVEEAATAVDKATNLAGLSGQALAEIVELAVGASDRVQAIATAAEEQSSTSDEITRSITEVNSIAENTNKLIFELKRTVQELSELARRLEDLSSRHQPKAIL